MSLKEELSKNRKLSPKLRMVVMRLDDAADPEQPQFSALIQASASFNGVSGADTHAIAGGIFSAHNITLNGLKNLVDDDSVSYVEGSTPMFPAQTSKPPRTPGF
jgi:hypothetical protein